MALCGTVLVLRPECLGAQGGCAAVSPDPAQEREVDTAQLLPIGPVASKATSPLSLGFLSKAPPMTQLTALSKMTWGERTALKAPGKDCQENYPGLLPPV